MTIKIQRETVRIVCPHCRRTYVIKVDLKKIYRTKPRAVCSRCGGRFEVIQRMYEIEEVLTSTNRRDSRHHHKQGRRARSTEKKNQDQVTVNVDRVQRRVQRDIPRVAREEIVVPEASARPASHLTPPTPEQMRESPAFPPSADSFTSPMQNPSPTAPPWPTSTMPPAPSPYPIWSALSPLPEPASVRAPSADDLETPMPWLARAVTSLDEIDIPIAETAEVLEWLLTDQSERPQGASPPPVPPSARRDASPSTAPDEEP